MHEQPHQPTIRELLRPIMVHRFLWVSCVVVAIAASVVYSILQEPTYTARASVSFQSESRDLGIVGVAFAPSQTAAELASAGAQTIIQPSAVRRVKASIDSPLSVDELTQKVTTTVRPSSNLVVVEADESTARRAQRLANEFARQGAAQSNERARRQYAQALRQLRRRGPGRRDATSRAVFREQLGRLQTLSAIARPAEVAEVARLPDSPSSPRPLRNAFLAGILGLVVGLLAAFLRDSFDRRLRTVADISNELHLPLIGHVSGQVLGRGPHPDRENSVSSVDWELFRILRRNLDFLAEGQDVRVVAVTSALPEEGKTTVAGFLAFASAAAGKRTLLIDCDLRQPALAQRIGIKESPGITDFAAGRADPQEILQAVRFGDPSAEDGAGPISREDIGEEFQHHLAVISAGTRTRHPVEVIRSERFTGMLDQVRGVYDLVILDTAPLLSVVDSLELLPHADGVLICVRAYQTTRDQARAGRAAIDRLPDIPIGLVVTGTRGIHETDYGYYGQYGYTYR